MERLLEILMYLLPAGGLGSVLTWLVATRVRRARTDRETSNIYQELYDGLRQTVKDQNYEIKNQQEQILRLQQQQMRLLQVVNQARICRYWGNSCPIHRQLRGEEGAKLYTPRCGDQHTAPRHHEPQGEATDEQRKPARGEGADSSADLEPP